MSYAIIGFGSRSLGLVMEQIGHDPIRGMEKFL
jgi:hypothetical protein